MRLDELIKAYISFFGFEPEKLTVQIEGGEARRKSKISSICTTIIC